MLGIKERDLRTDKDESWIGPAPWIDIQPPGPIARMIVERDHRFTSPSYTRDYPLVVRRAHGSVIEDVDGNRYLDFAAGIAVCATGHTHPRVVHAIQTQAQELIHICGSDFYYIPMVEVCERLARITPGQFKKRVFLTNSGTEAVEGAIKLVRRHTGRKRLIAFFGAFHGRTLGALSLTHSKPKQRVGFAPLLPGVTHVPFGNTHRIREMFERGELDPCEVAAIFVEPIQGEGGYVVAPDGFLSDLRALCDQHGIQLIFDEIQSGIGRTGKMFACEHFGVIPDVLCTAKGLASGMPLGAFVAREELMDWPPGAHGSTFGGNPVCCAAANATIDLVEAQYMENAANLGPHLQARLNELGEKYQILKNVRGLGFMIGVDVVRKKSGRPDATMRKRICYEAFRRGLILLPCGNYSIRFCPPLCINKTQIDVGMDILDEALATTEY